MQLSITNDWVRGFADRASYVHRSSNAIVLTATTDALLRPLCGYLKQQGYSCRVRSAGGRWELRVGGLESLSKWNDEIGFLDSSKARMLKEVIRGKN